MDKHKSYVELFSLPIQMSQSFTRVPNDAQCPGARFGHKEVREDIWLRNVFCCQSLARGLQTETLPEHPNPRVQGMGEFLFKNIVRLV